MNEFIIECVIIYNDNHTEYKTINLFPIEGNSTIDSIKRYILVSTPNVKEIIITDVLRITKRSE